MLDWSRFDSRTIGAERAFEAFAAQLFERWLRRENGSRLSGYVLHGAGGDGGVEAFATLPDGKVVGLQAKWFPGNLDESRVEQIRRSVTTATSIFPKLREYVIALPRNLTKGTKGKGGKLRKGGVERWSDLITELARTYPDLEVLRWDESALLEQLALSGNQELKALWFEGELTQKKLNVAWEKARTRLGHRYMPDLHAVGLFEETLASDLWTADWLREAKRKVQQAATLLSQSKSALGDFVQVTIGRRSAELDAVIPDMRATIENLALYAAKLVAVLGTGPDGSLVPIPNTDALAQFGDVIEEFRKKEGYFAGEFAESSVKATETARDFISDVSRRVLESSRPRLVIGPAGCGKTHAGAHAVDRLVTEHRPALFIQAKGIDPAQGIAAILSKTLDVGTWPAERILDALEALAILHQTSMTVGADAAGFIRAALVIDGLEESSGWSGWVTPLADLLVEASRRPRLHVIATARPETMRRISIPQGFEWLELPEDSGISLPDMLKRYCDRYDVDIEPVPWLGWALRNPLEVRMLAEEFRGGRISAATGAKTNLLTLFRSKLTRLEVEARERAGRGAWSENLNLVSATLEVLSDLTADNNPGSVVDVPIIERLAAGDPEFTAGRVRLVLAVLVEHGLIDTWFQPSEGLRSPRPEYLLATRHVSDFIVANQYSRAVAKKLDQREVVQYPSALRWRPASAVLFAALLAEQGHFVTDISWAEVPDGLTVTHARSLALVAPDIAATRRDEVRSLLVSTTASNRETVQGLVQAVSRIPEHPLGPPLLDEALRALPLARRDPIWSVPEDLDGVGPWKGSYNRVLDTLELEAKVDAWSGSPLLVAWTCSSVVESRRRRARELLAVWGSQRLEEMVRLLRHMSSVDDPQVVDDIVVSALGAAVGAKFGDRALLSLARLVDELFFAEAASAWTPSVVVRMAARGIVERAALLYPRDVEELLNRARPPYRLRGDAWPPFDPDEVRETGHFGGKVVNGDLSWYVAERCFHRFSATEPGHLRDFADTIDHSLRRAIEDDELQAPPKLALKVKSERTAESNELLDDEASRGELLTALRDLHRQETDGASGDTDNLDENALLEWAAKKLVDKRGKEGREPAYSPEFKELVSHVAEATGIEHPSPNAIRNAMIAHLVRHWGWSEDGFSRYEWNKPSAVVDDAIAKRHGSGASHGSRSAVCRFREKYVWAAVDRVAGELADRLPVWSDEEGVWVRLTNLDDIGNGLPDPLPKSWQSEPPNKVSVRPWTPDGVLPQRFADELSLVRRAERWLVEADLPDPKIFIRGSVEDWSDAAVLSFRHYRRGHQSCIDQLVEVRAFGINAKDLDLLKRDAPFLRKQLYEYGAWVEEGVYVSPAIACWAPWLIWRGEDQGYNSFDADGNVRRVRLVSAVGSVNARFEDDWPNETKVWMPSPSLRRALGIVAMRGDRFLRAYCDRNSATVAVERDVPSKSFAFDHHYLAMELASFARVLADQQLIPVWAVRIYREATPALYMRGHDFEVPADLHHRSRDAMCLVVGDPLIGNVEILRASDVYEPWH